MLDFQVGCHILFPIIAKNGQAGFIIDYPCTGNNIIEVMKKMKKRIFITVMVIMLILTACAPRPQQRPIEEQKLLEQQRPQQDQRQQDIARGHLETNLSSIYDPGEVRNCRITADTVNVKSGTGNNFTTVGTLKRNDVVRVLRTVNNNWYVVQMDNNQIGAIDAENATPVVKEGDVQRVPQPVPQQEQRAETQPRIAEREDAQPQQTQRAQQPQAQQPQQNQTAYRLSEQEQRMVDLVNQERTKNGLSALTVDLQVARVAGIKSQDMADNNYFSHNSPTYGSPFDMLKSFGISYLHAGENLAGNQSVEKAHTALMNSSGHRQNILSPNFTHIGVGVRASDKYGFLYTQLFISKPK